MRTLRIAMIALCCVTCTDIIEEDLTGVGVVLLTPPDQYSTTSNLIHFKWEEVPYATEYLFQLVMPDFSSPVHFLADSLVSNGEFSSGLSPGTYAWRVRAINGSSQTDFYERMFTIGQATDLSGLFPVLLAPTDGHITTVDSITFSWDTLTGAVDHRFELRDGGETGPIVQAQIVQGSSFLLQGLSEGELAWGVQAQNATSSSSFSYRDLIIDRTAPTIPMLIDPADNAVVPDASLSLGWTSGTDNLTATVDSLFIFDAAQSLVRSLEVTGGVHTDSLGLGTYSWTVRTVDAAGNGATSTQRSFTVQ